MSIDNALASVAVKSLKTAVAWYELLLGRPADSTPMPEVAEWKFRRGGWLQVYQLPERAGSGSFTLAVSSIDEMVVHVEKLGIDASQKTSGERVKTLMITDLDGNHIAFAEAIDKGMAQSMTQNKKTVDRYMDAFRRSDHEQILSCLTDEVEWEIPGAFHARGKEAFDQQIENDGFVGSPAITVTRLAEDNDVVMAEGSVRTQRKDGTFLNLAFCDVFDMQGGKIRKLTSYLMETK